MSGTESNNSNCRFKAASKSWRESQAISQFK
jgi:hypothetical protein